MGFTGLANTGEPAPHSHQAASNTLDVQQKQCFMDKN
jgi:hypothetical protein